MGNCITIRHANFEFSKLRTVGGVGFLPLKHSDFYIIVDFLKWLFSTAVVVAVAVACGFVIACPLSVAAVVVVVVLVAFGGLRLACPQSPVVVAGFWLERDVYCK